MGKATIVSHVSGGLYNVTYHFEVASLNQKVADAQARITELNTTEIVAALGEENNAKAAYDDAVDAVNVLIAQYNSGAEVKPELIEAAALAQVLYTEWQIARNKTRLLYAEKRNAEVVESQATALAATFGSIALQAYCADYTVDLTGTVGMCEINGDLTYGENLIITPGDSAHGSGAYNVNVHGMQSLAYGSTPAGSFWNYAVKPGWQKGRPVFVKGKILALNRSSHLAKIELTNVPSRVRNLDVRPREDKEEQLDGEAPWIFNDVPIDYMTCDSEPFKVGDTVLCQFYRPPTDPAPDPNEPLDAYRGEITVIGFVGGPKPCGSVGFLNTRFGTPTNGGSSGSDLTDLGTGSGWTQEANAHSSLYSPTRWTNAGNPFYFQVIDNVSSNDDVMWIIGPQGRHFHGNTQEWLENVQLVTPPAMIWGKRYGRGRSWGDSNTGSVGYAPTFRLGTDTRIVGVGLQNAGTPSSEHVVIACINRWPGDGTGNDGIVEFYRAKWPTSTDVATAYDPSTNPNGWRYLGQTVYAHATFFECNSPVFFNASGTEAVHVRVKRPAAVGGTRQVRTPRGRGAFTAHTNPEWIDYDIRKIAIPNDNTSLIDDVGQSHPITTIPSGMADVTHKRWIADTSQSGYLTDRRTETLGSYICYADYDGDTVVYGKIHVDCTRREYLSAGVAEGTTRYIGSRWLESRRLIELEFTKDGTRIPLVDADWNMRVDFDETSGATESEPEYWHAPQSWNGAVENYYSQIPPTADPDDPERFANVCRTFHRLFGYIDVRNGTYLTKEHENWFEISPVYIRYPLLTLPDCEPSTSVFRRSHSSHLRRETYAQKWYVENVEHVSWDEEEVGPFRERPLGSTKTHQNCVLDLGSSFWWYNLTANEGYHEQFCSYGDGSLYVNEGPPGYVMAMETHTHWLGQYIPRQWIAGTGCPEVDTNWTFYGVQYTPIWAAMGDFILVDLETVGDSTQDEREVGMALHGSQIRLRVNKDARCTDTLWGTGLNQYMCPDYNDDLTGYPCYLPQYYQIYGGVAVDIDRKNVFCSAETSTKYDSFSTGSGYDIVFLSGVNEEIKGIENPVDSGLYEWPAFETLIGTAAPYYPLWPDDPNDN